jgi:hypothetical protein
MKLPDHSSSVKRKSRSIFRRPRRLPTLLLRKLPFDALLPPRRVPRFDELLRSPRELLLLLEDADRDDDLDDLVPLGIVCSFHVCGEQMKIWEGK